MTTKKTRPKKGDVVECHSDYGYECGIIQKVFRQDGHLWVDVSVGNKKKDVRTCRLTSTEIVKCMICDIKLEGEKDINNSVVSLGKAFYMDGICCSFCCNMISHKIKDIIHANVELNKYFTL